ncbi:uncharacterized protein LOC123293640 [Chrysoperla carnea]|uniref:uncharacterized protein LOC123293640 n=1 Tax=Chrysoperla carnea TaxID=189513 RepID=UPI001D07D722|nr:uncharacterized protein LOC123293640 [Chrysoperla carnea]
MNFAKCLICFFGLCYFGKIVRAGYDLKLKGYEIEGKDYFDLSGMKMIKMGKKRFGFNGTIIVHQDITDDLHVSCAACKKTGSHYIETLSIHIKDMIFCNMYEEDQYISQDYKRSIQAPMKCPIKKGTYHIINYEPDPKSIPPTIPEGEWRVVNEFTITKDDNNREIIGKTIMFFLVARAHD